jgi:hypothetical protein
MRTRRGRGDAATLPLFAGVVEGPPAAPAPEVAVPCEAAFDHEDWRFSVDWDGMRALLTVGPGGQPRLVDERLRDASELFPEIVAAAVAIADRPAVLDGVLAVLDAEGRPDLAALSLRMARSAASRDRPVVYLATDLLHLDGAPLTGWTLDRRQQALAALLAPQARLQAPGWVVGHGRAFCEAAAERGLPAVLARRGDAPYRPGVASPERLRIALEERSDAVVAAAMRTLVAYPRRRHAAAGGPVPPPLRRRPALRPRPRLVHPAAGGPATPGDAGGRRLPAHGAAHSALRRRLTHSSRGGLVEARRCPSDSSPSTSTEPSSAGIAP